MSAARLINSNLEAANGPYRRGIYLDFEGVGPLEEMISAHALTSRACIDHTWVNQREPLSLLFF